MPCAPCQTGPSIMCSASCCCLHAVLHNRHCILYDASNPVSPKLIAQNQGYAPHDIFFDGQYTYLADQDKGFIILEYLEELQK